MGKKILALLLLPLLLAALLVQGMLQLMWFVICGVFGVLVTCFDYVLLAISSIVKKR